MTYFWALLVVIFGTLLLGALSAGNFLLVLLFAFLTAVGYGGLHNAVERKYVDYDDVICPKCETPVTRIDSMRYYCPRCRRDYLHPGEND